MLTFIAAVSWMMIFRIIILSCTLFFNENRYRKTVQFLSFCRFKKSLPSFLRDKNRRPRSSERGSLVSEVESGNEVGGWEGGREGGASLRQIFRHAVA